MCYFCHELYRSSTPFEWEIDEMPQKKGYSGGGPHRAGMEVKMFDQHRSGVKVSGSKAKKSTPKPKKSSKGGY